MYIENSKNPIQDLSFSFAVRVVKFYKNLTEQKRVFVLSKQILRSGTSIGANLTMSSRSLGLWLRLLNQRKFSLNSF